jgi:hypothetical protein
MFFWLSSFFATAYIANAEEARYSLHGELDYSDIPFNKSLGMPVAQISTTFDIKVDGGNWVISSKPNGGGKVFSEWTVTHFGDRTFSYSVFDEQALANLKAGAKEIGQNQAIAVVSKDIQPFDAESLSSKNSILWLAFASGKFVKQGNQSLNKVWFDPENDGKKDVIVESQDVAPSLPISVAFLAPKIITAGGMRSTNYYTNFIYRVQSWTNVAGLTFPRSFSCAHFYMKNDGTIFQYEKYKGLVSDVNSKNVDPVSSPIFIKNTIVSDYSISTNENEFFDFNVTNASYSAATNNQDLSLPKKIEPAREILDETNKARFSTKAILAALSIFSIFALTWLVRKVK